MQGLPFNLRDADPYTRSVIRSAADIISHTARRISWYLRMSSVYTAKSLPAAGCVSLEHCRPRR